MIDDGAEDEVAASLARLRMFLAPHQAAGSSSEVGHQPPNVADAEMDHSTGEHSTIFDDDNGDNSDDLCGDLPPVTEQLSPAGESVMVSLHAEASEDEVPVAITHPEYESREIGSMPQDKAESSQPLGPPTGAVSTVSPISSLSKEYSRVRYLLQCSLPSYSIHDDMVMWDMRNPALATQYEAHVGGLLELDSWVDVDKLSAAMSDKHCDGNTVQAGRTYEGTKKFATGAIAIDPTASKKGRKQLVLCKIAVGRSMAIESEEDAATTILPPGYHSFYVLPKADSIESEQPNYHHEYILCDALQILPQYLVRFSYSVVEPKASHACALCEKQSATLYCKACDAELCADCDNKVHSANKLVERHKRTALREPLGSLPTAGKSRRRSNTQTPATNQGSASEQLSEDEVNAVVGRQVEESMADFQATCRVHDGKKIEFYCPVCTTPVCVNCKMVGDHSTGDKGTHRLLAISGAYEQCLRESFKSDPLVDSRRSVIENKLALVAQWEKDIERNRERVEEAIRQQYEQALISLDSEAKKKISVLKGESLEFNRQLQQIRWLDECLDERRLSSSVVEFLSVWNQHKLLRAEQRDFPVSSQTPIGCDQIKADLQLIGSLQVVAAEQAIPRLSFTGSDFGDLCHADDRFGPQSPRGSIEPISSPPASVRRPSDNDIRRKLLSMRSVEKRAQDGTSTPSPNKALAAMGTLSPEGRKMMEEIRNDLFARRTGRSSSGSRSPSMVSPLRSPTLNTSLSIHPGALATPMSSTISAPLKQHTSTAAWTALLRHELAASKETSASR